MRPKLHYITLFCTLFLGALPSQAQNYDCNVQKHWFFGRGLTPGGAFTGESIHMEFACPGGNFISATPVTSVLGYGNEGTGVINNLTTGNWMLYSDGDNIVYPVGPPTSGLGGNGSSSQSVAFAPINVCPVDSFYIFSNPTGGNSYGIISYALGNNTGSVAPQGNLPIPPAAQVGNSANLRHGEGMLIVPNSTSIGSYWLITRLLKNAGSTATDAFVVYEVTQSGVNIHQVFDANTDGNGNIGSSALGVAYTNFDFNLNRSEIAVADISTSTSVFTLSFNPNSGLFSGNIDNIISLQTLGAYDVEYSPNDQYLYYSQYDGGIVHAYDLNTQVAMQILATSAAGIKRGVGIQTGPDGNIYALTATTSNWSAWDSELWRITNPNTPAVVAAPFMSFPDFLNSNLPNFVNIHEFDLHTTSNQTTVCPNDSIKIGFVADFSTVPYDDFSWYQNGALIPGETDSILWAQAPGTYHAEINFTGGCTYESHEITISPALDLSISINSVICNTNDVELSIDICNPSDSVFNGNTDISFYDADPLLGGATIIHTENIATSLAIGACQTISVTIPSYIGDLYGVLNAGSTAAPFTINDFPLGPITECDYQNNIDMVSIVCCPLNMDLTDTTFCTGDPNMSVTEGGQLTGGTTNWYTDNSYTVVLQAGTTLVPDDIVGTTTYYISETDGNCTIFDSINVLINPIPSVSAGATQTICLGDPVTLTANNPDNANLSWDNGITDGTPFNPVSTATYTVSADLNGCVSFDNTSVTVNPLPAYSLQVTEPDNCGAFLGSVEFNPGVSAATPFTISGPNGSSQNLIQDNLAFGTHLFTITDTNGCTTTETVSFFPSTVPLEASFNYSPTEIFTWDPSVDFFNQTIGGASYQWLVYENGNVHSYTDEDITHIFPSIAGNYEVCLIADLGGSCTDTTCQTITVVEDLFLYVPNIFTPDGDKVNNSFDPIFSDPSKIADYHLTIFNRWGEILFESYDATKGWNGHYGNRGLVQDGVYIWQITYRLNGHDYIETKRGHVTVLK